MNNAILNREELVRWSHEVLKVVNADANPAIAAEVQQAAETLRRDRFVLAILGKAKRGKSTLLNSLLGRRDDLLAPIDRLPASSAISRFRWSESERITVHFHDGRSCPVTAPAVRDFVTEEGNPQNGKGVQVVDIEAPFPTLARDLELVDTPGAGSMHEHHDALLHAFIPQADAVIFLVTARMPLDRDELELLQALRAADIRKVFFAINKVDECAPRDLEDAVAHNLTLLAQAQIAPRQIHRISAKRAFAGDRGESGVDSLVLELEEFLMVEKGRTLGQRFVARVCAAVSVLAQSLAVRIHSSDKSTAEIESEIASLREKKRLLDSERTFAERGFLAAWARAVGEFEEGIRSVRHSVRSAVQTKLQQISLFDISNEARQLPTYLTRVLEEALQPVAARFEESARRACEKLQAEFPTLKVGDTGAIICRTREGHTAVAGSVGGVAVAAAGAGFATAGAAAAATIAAANATALAATTSVVAPSLLTAIASTLGSLGAPPALTGALSLLGTGTATVSAPAAITAAPLWVALAGPVGWTLAGVGVLAVPFSWRLSKLKLKEKVADASEQQIEDVFIRLQGERVAALRTMGAQIAGEIQLRLDQQLQQVETALVDARNHRPSADERSALCDKSVRLQALIARVASEPA